MRCESRLPGPALFLPVRLLYPALLVLFAGGLFAATPIETTIETKTGFLIPSQCKSEEGVKPEPKGATDAWPAPHSTECALRAACIESGYGLWVVDRFYRLDEDGQKKALNYFRTTQRTSYNKVQMTGDYRDPNAVRIKKIVPTD